MAQEIRGELPEGAEPIPAETQKVFEEKEKELNRRILEKAASDAEFRTALVESPKEALDTAGFGEELAALTDPGQMSEVAGHYHYSTWWRHCHRYSYAYNWHHY